MLWFCYIIACALYALGFGSYFWEFIQRYFPPIADLVFRLAGHKAPVLMMTTLVSIVFILINMRGTAVTSSVENIITMAKIIILGIFIAYGLKPIFKSQPKRRQALRLFCLTVPEVWSLPWG